MKSLSKYFANTKSWLSEVRMRIQRKVEIGNKKARHIEVVKANGGKYNFNNETTIFNVNLNDQTYDCKG